jgi:arginyl-tRNA synthetase
LKAMNLTWEQVGRYFKFYHDCNILNAEKSIKEARLVLVYLTQKIIKEAMDLLGIQCPEEM